MVARVRVKPRQPSQLDKEIDLLFRQNCSNIQINMMDIPRVFAEARKAREEGRDMKEAIISFVNSIRKN